ncbi:MAG: PIG-L family deacetylase [Anaerolineales bacterium]|nr:PIG-L family deacetylase [Anaerolineales bacterium]
MNYHNAAAEIYIPDGLPVGEALSRTTHLGISAHQDDLEIMAVSPILECFQQEAQWFTGVVVTDGRGSPRKGLYEQYDDEKMRQVRFKEQQKAAFIGDYAAQIMLDYPSKLVKDGSDPLLIEDLVNILKTTFPRVVYTHNLADKHQTHIGVAIKVIKAIRELPAENRPEKLYGCEVWRALDWMPDEEKVTFDCSLHDNLQSALLGVFDSQISGGKRYDLATMGRRLANATYYASHAVDDSSRLTYAMDLTPLIEDTGLSIQVYVQGFINRFAHNIDMLIASVL